MIEDMVCHCRRENVFDVEESPQSRHRHNQCFLVFLMELVAILQEALGEYRTKQEGQNAYEVSPCLVQRQSLIRPLHVHP